ncbi:hypothetical protein RCO27_10050 [Sphingosinicella sp. LHD-64]|uniref:hypothetical protein n=1 Tax=Sphingosinicella sp. LHD-64 TaxID=3072139 RepID=UPI00280F024B|nr:hypothetical protein [Sphingosinicella sp. LHD-64]MDQ8756573.1 hypothetical protein [Sphingosinicella sp. LHD-64]
MRNLILVAAFLISGCWTGDMFYAATELRAPVAPGDYRLLSPDGQSDDARVSILPDGLTRFTPRDDREPVGVGFATLDADRGIFVAWVATIGEEAAPSDTTVYGLLEARPDGEYAILMPSCLEMETLATSAGATIVPDSKVRSCRFPDRASLETALRQLVPRLPTEGARLVALRDAGRD